MEKKNYKIIHDIDDIKINSVDSIISDVRNDSEMAMSKETWKKAYRVIKPGAYMLILSGNKLSHRICCAIEDGGFEIKDSIMWIYKSNVLTLQPDYCNIVVARKPTELSILDNIDLYGVGGINIDECRVETSDNLNGGAYSKGSYSTEDNVYKLGTKRLTGEYRQPDGRFPANTILTYDETDFDEVCGGFPYTKTGSRKTQPQKEGSWNAVGIKFKMTYACEGSEGSASRYFKNCKYTEDDFYDIPQRYFYCGKATKQDRDEGLNDFEEYILKEDTPEEIQKLISKCLTI